VGVNTAREPHPSERLTDPRSWPVGNGEPLPAPICGISSDEISTEAFVAVSGFVAASDVGFFVILDNWLSFLKYLVLSES
jgi:hypothetical protein